MKNSNSDNTSNRNGFNKLMNFSFDGFVAGVDEAGRGAIAGPVTAAAVILDPKIKINGIQDSKKLRPTEREKLRTIIENRAYCWAVAHVGVNKIDQSNILIATFLAMHQAIKQLKVRPELLIIDGNRFNPYEDIEFQCIVKGDSLYKEIAAASILAKTHRDQLMKKLNLTHPQYHWKDNKGYPTKKHKKILSELGGSPWHRKSFNWV